MKTYNGNIWDLHKDGSIIIIPTNLGYNKDGNNIMGAGLAKQAAQFFPNLPKEYGKILIDNPEYRGIVLFEEYGVICFPSKPRNKENPHLSWQSNASLELIDFGCECLMKLLKKGTLKDKQIAMPLVGCGLGGLDKQFVTVLLNRYFANNDQITLVKQG